VRAVRGKRPVSRRSAMKSTENAGAAGFMYANIASRIMEQAIQQGVEAGVKAGAEYIEDQRRQAKKGRYDRRLHNTRLLLKNYRRFRAHVNEGVNSTKKVDGKRPTENAINILDELDEYSYNDGMYIESIKRSQERTAIILRHIDKMLEYYRIDCDLNGTDEDIRRYKVVMASYINESKMKPQEIADAFGIERRTIYRDISIAMKHLTALIFGIDGLRID